MAMLALVIAYQSYLNVGMRFQLKIQGTQSELWIYFLLFNFLVFPSLASAGRLGHRFLSISGRYRP